MIINNKDRTLSMTPFEALELISRLSKGLRNNHLYPKNDYIYTIGVVNNTEILAKSSRLTFIIEGT